TSGQHYRFANVHNPPRVKRTFNSLIWIKVPSATAAEQYSQRKHLQNFQQSLLIGHNCATDHRHRARRTVEHKDGFCENAAHDALRLGSNHESLQMQGCGRVGGEIWATVSPCILDIRWLMRTLCSRSDSGIVSL